MISKALVTAGGLGLAVGLWFAYFWLDEQRRWNRPILVRETVPIDMDRYWRAL